jgi:hypothetical protein
MYKISCLHPIGVRKKHVEPCIQCTPIGFLKVTTLANKWSPKPITINVATLALGSQPSVSHSCTPST